MAHPPLPPGDDPAIANETILWRRIIPQWWKKDPNDGQYRLTSEAFDDARDKSPMSVGIASEIDGGAETFLRGTFGNGIAAFTAGYARQTCGLAVARARIDNEPPWHAHVIGKKKPPIRRLLRVGSTIVIPPREIEG